MIAQEIATEVKESLALTKMLKSELYAAQKVLSDTYNKKLIKPENYIYDLKEQYKELALEVAVDENECPRSRWGSPLNPHEFEVTEKGIDMMWEDESSYYASRFHHFTATWEQILNKQTQNGEENENN